MTVTLLVLTDGRDECLARTLASLDEMVTGPITRRVIHDDTGSPDHAAFLAETYPDYAIAATGARAGFGGAIQSAWASLEWLSNGSQWVLASEDDFVVTRPVDLKPMMLVLEANPHLAQLALRRQPWNDEEKAAGGIVELHPEDYMERSSEYGSWLEHRRFWTTNTSLFRRSLVDVGWPDGANSEGIFTHKLLDLGTPEVTGPEVRFGFWGSRDSGEWVEHIGNQRVGTGY